VNHGTAMPWQLTFGPLTLATSQPSPLTVPSTVAVRAWPPTSCAFIEKVRADILTVPVAWAIDFMLSHEIMPDRVPPGPATMCQSSAGQLACAVEWKTKSLPSGTPCADATPQVAAIARAAPTIDLPKIMCRFLIFVDLASLPPPVEGFATYSANPA
jgi:hypothetical protein